MNRPHGHATKVGAAPKAALPPIKPEPQAGQAGSRSKTPVQVPSQLPNIKPSAAASVRVASPNFLNKPTTSQSSQDNSVASGWVTKEFEAEPISQDVIRAASRDSTRRPRTSACETDEESSNDSMLTVEAFLALEDPEADYWTANPNPPKNPIKAYDEATKRIDTPVAAKKLDLAAIGLASLPDKVFNKSELKTLIASGNALEVLPASIASLRHLINLQIQNNKLRWIPFEIGDLSMLQVIKAQDNLLVALPASIGKLTQLQSLAVSRNPLRSLPPQLCDCPALKELEATGLESTLSIPPIDVLKNGLPASLQYLGEYRRRLASVEQSAALDLSSFGLKSSTLPLEVTSMTSVTSLRLSRNSIPSLSSSLQRMLSLAELDLQDCIILRELNPEMCLMTQLTRIDITGCEAMTSPPPEVTSRGTVIILAYLRKLFTARFSKDLDLSKWDLSNADEAIAKLRGLTSLSFAENNIGAIPPSFGKLRSIRILDLRNNNIQVLPTQLEALTALTNVDLSENRLRGPVFLDSWVESWARLRQCDARGNPDIRRLPLAVAYWTSLESLRVDEEHFVRPPPEVLKQGSTASVDYCRRLLAATKVGSKLLLNGCGLRACPDDIDEFTAIKSLHLHHNNLRTISDTLSSISSLRELLLSHNPLSKIPQVVQNFVRLKTLGLDNTLLDCIPQFITQLHSLRVLSAVQNSLTALPEDICVLTTLTRLNVDNNQIRSLPESIGSLTHLQDLSLTKNTIGWLPRSVGKLRNLVELRMAFNRLTALPEEIGALASLVRLRLGNNLLVSLPSELGFSTSLEELSFQSNQISVIPVAVGNLPKLRIINFEGNPIDSPRGDVLKLGSDGVILYLRKLYQSAISSGLDLALSGLHSFPIDACTIPGLHSLVLDDNGLTLLPPELMVLTALTFLSARRNELNEIAVECGMMTSLTRLLLSDNKLSRIPLSFGRARRLHEIDLNNNAEWKSPPPEIVHQGSSIVINYLLQFGESYSTGKITLEAMRLCTFPKELYTHSHLFLPLQPAFLYSADLSHNKIVKLPDDLNLLESIIELNFDDNELDEFPISLGLLRSLKFLSFNRNYFHSFPKAACSCTHLEVLRFSGNPVTCLDLGVGNLSMLQELSMDSEIIQEPCPEVVGQGTRCIVSYLSQVQFSLSSFCLYLPSFRLITFPSELSKRQPGSAHPPAAQLLEVSMPSNLLDCIPPVMSCLANMTRLDLSGNQLARLSPAMAAWRCLRHLNLTSNKLVELPTSLGMLTDLETLHIANNQLTWLPAETTRLVRLREALLDHNRLPQLFDGIECCVALTRLSVAHNVLSSLPPPLSRLPCLTSLSVLGNPLSSPPEEVRGNPRVLLGYLHRFDAANRTRHLDISGMGLKTFPSEIPALSNLRSLDISRNEIDSLPTSISMLVGLDALILDCNPLVSLPPELGALVGLRTLSHADCELRSPPQEVLEQGPACTVEYLSRLLRSRGTQNLDLGDLGLRRAPLEVSFMTGLTGLSLAGNHLHRLFVGVGELGLLRELQLDRNELQALPLALGKLTRLTSLSARSNKLRRLTDWVHGLAASPLQILDLAENQLEELPPSLLRLTSLTRLEVDFNPFEDPPREVVAGGKKPIFQYIAAFETARTGHPPSSLCLTGLGLLRLPVACASVTSLVELRIDDNQLQDLPLEIFEVLQNTLEVLSCRRNRLIRLDWRLCRLRKLRIFDLEGNDMVDPPLEVCAQGASAVIRFLSACFEALSTHNLRLPQLGLLAPPQLALRALPSLTVLDLSGNRIESLDPNLFCPVVADGKNGISASPGRPTVPSSLFELILDGNSGLVVLPDELFIGLQNLRRLSCSRCGLVDVPEVIGKLSELIALDVQYNKIREIPPELGLCNKLQDVAVEFNENMRVPPPEVVERGSFAVIEYLRRLVDFTMNQICDLSSSGLSDPVLPDYVLKQGNLLQSLILRDNLLLSLHNSASRLTALTLLDLSGNRMRRLPPAALHMPLLRVLRVAGNDLGPPGPALPPKLGWCMPVLEELDLRNNPRLELLPPSIGILTKLRTLALEGCGRLRGPPREVGAAGAQVVVDYQARLLRVLGPDDLAQLYCYTNRTAGSLPVGEASCDPSTGNASGCIEISDGELFQQDGDSRDDDRLLSSNVEASVELVLERFDLTSTNSDIFDPQVTSATRIVSLSLASNRLARVDPLISVQLTRLCCLNLSFNLLRSLSPVLSTLALLEVLHLGGNLLTRLAGRGGWLGRCLPNLVELSAPGNRLERVDAALGALGRLKRLDLSGNPTLLTLPPELALLGASRTKSQTNEVGTSGFIGGSLSLLGLDGCEGLRSPPKEVVRQGRDATLAYLSALLNAGGGSGEGADGNVEEEEEDGEGEEEEEEGGVEEEEEKGGVEEEESEHISETTPNENQSESVENASSVHPESSEVQLNILEWHSSVSPGQEGTNVASPSEFPAFPPSNDHTTDAVQPIDDEKRDDPASNPASSVDEGGQFVDDEVFGTKRAKMKSKRKTKGKVRSPEGWENIAHGVSSVPGADETVRDVHQINSGTGVLILTGMGLEAYPIEAAAMPNLTRIDLADNLLEEVPARAGKQPLLEDLSIAHNQLVRVHPDALSAGRFPVLFRLHLPFNRLVSLPAGLADLPCLTSLILSDNLFVALDEPLCNATGLTDLRLDGNRLERVAACAGRLAMLRRLDLQRNSLNCLPDQMFLGDDAPLVSSSNLIGDPSSQRKLFGWGMTSLTRLALDRNRVTSLPHEGFERLTDLAQLHLESNELRMLPTGLGCLGGLFDFEFHDNPLDEIPKEIQAAGPSAVLDYLGRLHAAGPPPEGVTFVRPGSLFGKSKILVLDRLSLTEIPPYVWRLTYLEELSLRGNRLSGCFSSEVARLAPNLRRLDIRENSLRFLPPQLSLCAPNGDGSCEGIRADSRKQGLTTLDLDHNPWDDPPMEVRAAGCAIVLRYLRALFMAPRTGSLDASFCHLKSVPPALSRLGGGSDAYHISVFAGYGEGPDTKLQDENSKKSAEAEVGFDATAGMDLASQKLPLSGTVDLSGNNLTTLRPAEIAAWRGVRTILLGQNRLSALPDAGLRSLANINVASGQKMSTTGKGFSEGPLLSLSLERNLLTSIPGGMAWLSSLTDLNLDDNRLSVLPMAVCRLGSLVRLGLSGNRIAELYSEIGFLSRLQELRIARNGLHTLSDEICDCENLEVFSYKFPMQSSLLKSNFRICTRFPRLFFADFGLVLQRVACSAWWCCCSRLLVATFVPTSTRPAW
mmetsp:Transcript_5864/g.18920  ORF Transcript_5864/g.18920 Transcript_5864/m.18920 type:complete len:3255 (-) Transcript_5864:1891-11655(-)